MWIPSLGCFMPKSYWVHRLVHFLLWITLTLALRTPPLSCAKLSLASPFLFIVPESSNTLLAETFPPHSPHHAQLARLTWGILFFILDHNEQNTGLAKKFIQFFHKMLWKNLNEFWGQPNIWWESQPALSGEWCRIQPPASVSYWDSYPGWTGSAELVSGHKFTLSSDCRLFALKHLYFLLTLASRTIGFWAVSSQA